MKDEDKAKEQLTKELVELRHRVAELEESETELRRAEESLRESEGCYRTLIDDVIDTSAVGILVLNENFRVVWVNQTLERFFGLRRDKTIGRDKRELIRERIKYIFEDAEAFAETVLATYDNNTYVESFECHVLSHDEREERWLQHWSRPIRLGLYAGGRVELYHDITGRKQMEEESRQRTAQLEALREVGLELTAQLDLDALLRSIVSRAVGLVGGDSGGLYLYRPERDALEWAMAVGPNLSPIGTVLQRGEGLSGKVWETGEPLIVDDYQAWEGRAAVYEGYSFGATVGVPVRWGEEFLGVLDVLADAPHTFSLADAELLSLFAQQAAIAIENARLYEEVQHRLQEMNSLLEISRNITSTLELDEVLRRVIEAAMAAIGPAEKGTLHLLDEEREELVVRASVGFSPETVAAARFRPGEGYAGWVFAHRQPVIVGDVKADQRTKPIDLPEVHEEKSALCVPLVVRDKAIGTLTLDNVTRYGAFAPEDLDLLTIFANQAAVAIENARLFGKAYRLTEELRLLSEATRDVSASLELDEVLERIATHLCWAAKATSGDIMILDESGKRATVRAQYWSPESSPRERTLDAHTVYDLTRHLAILQAMQENRPMVTHADDPDLEPATRDMMADFDGRSVLRIPIHVTGVLRGYALIWDSRRRHEWTDEEVRLCQTLASQAAVAVENARLYQEAERLGITDGLTGLYNRRYFYELLEREVVSINRYGGFLSLIMLDIDGFKGYNDTYGHVAGDALLRELAQLLARDIRKMDVAARYGGDEFVIFLPHTDKEQTVVLAERIRASVEGHRFPDEEEGSGKVTISMGVAVCPEDAVESEAVVKAADMALLKAKKQRNAVCVCGEMA